MRLPCSLLLVTLLLVTLLGGCSQDRSRSTSTSPSTSTSGSASPSSSPSDEAPTPTAGAGPRPVKDACHRMSLAQAVAPVAGGKAVACTRPHTAQTYKIGRLSLLASGHLVAVDSASVQAVVAGSCRSLLGAHVDASAREMRLSMVQTVWFTPSVAEGAAGADWYRCDVVALARAGRLAPLPRSSQGLVGSSSRFAMCGTAPPDAASFERVPCSVSHSWVAISSVDLSGPDYPSASQAGQQMESACRSAARARAGDPLDFTWSEERPTRAQWNAGQRYGICWTPA